jgi:divalent metal cation (Fe/Co/Zn/Cd) transporter
MGAFLKICGGIMLMIVGIFIFRSAIGLLFQGPIGFIIGIALIAGGIALFIKGWR